MVQVADELDALQLLMSSLQQLAVPLGMKGALFWETLFLYQFFHSSFLAFLLGLGIVSCCFDSADASTGDLCKELGTHLRHCRELTETACEANLTSKRAKDEREAKELTRGLCQESRCLHYTQPSSPV